MQNKHLKKLNIINDTKTCSKLRNFFFLNLVKSIYKNLMTISLFNSERLNVLPVSPGTKLECLFILLLIIIIPEVLECAIRQDKKKYIQIRI